MGKKPSTGKSISNEAAQEAVNSMIAAGARTAISKLTPKPKVITKRIQKNKTRKNLLGQTVSKTVNYSPTTGKKTSKTKTVTDNGMGYSMKRKEYIDGNITRKRKESGFISPLTGQKRATKVKVKRDIFGKGRLMK